VRKEGAVASRVAGYGALDGRCGCLARVLR
jgi:hypothetical protein